MILFTCNIFLQYPGDYDKLIPKGFWDFVDAYIEVLEPVHTVPKKVFF